jgi:SAM-dependent methyltransferase
MGLGIKSAIINKLQRPVPKQNLDISTADYWTDHNVTNHRIFESAQASLDYLAWRNAQYPHYIDLMPVKGFDGKVVLDYGCGPGHDLIGFGVYSKPARLIGMDLSSSSLQEARTRVNLHGFQAEIIQLDPDVRSLPLPDASVDHVHSSGVLHHVPDALAILKELRRVLKPGGTMNIMIYNYDSIWLHLYVAYVKRLVEGLYAGKSLREAFRYTTDGPNCPISNVYKPQEWIALCKESGLKASLKGVAVSLWECHVLQNHRYMACMNEALPAESREFLLGLTFDGNGLPMWQGQYAGIDGCYSVVRD